MTREIILITGGARSGKSRYAEQRALEIGAASGYSAIWMGLGLRETGGTLVTIEYDKERAAQAAANVKKAGLSDVVTVIPGDAFAEIPKVAGTFDFVFCDAWKRDYQKFFTMVFPRIDKGGLFLGHNVINKRDEMGDFLKTILTSPAVLTSIVAPSGICGTIDSVMCSGASTLTRITVSRGLVSATPALLSST